MEEARRRLQSIEVDSILESGYIEGISKMPVFTFSTILRTRRLDKVAAALLEGRVGIITEGHPLFWLCRQVSLISYGFGETTMNDTPPAPSSECCAYWLYLSH